jgi:hypothetical protein
MHDTWTSTRILVYSEHEPAALTSHGPCAKLLIRYVLCCILHHGRYCRVPTSAGAKLFAKAKEADISRSLLTSSLTLGVSRPYISSWRATDRIGQYACDRTSGIRNWRAIQSRNFF